MAGIWPEGLTQKSFNILVKCCKWAEIYSIDQLLEQAEVHLKHVHAAHKNNIYVNLKLAEQIVKNFKAIATKWDQIPKHCQPWLLGMMRYFCLTSDLESDFTSPIGFDDDVEIMNACLRFAGCKDLCIHPEDFDDV